MEIIDDWSLRIRISFKDGWIDSYAHNIQFEYTKTRRIEPKDKFFVFLTIHTGAIDAHFNLDSVIKIERFYLSKLEKTEFMHRPKHKHDLLWEKSK